MGYVGTDAAEYAEEAALYRAEVLFGELLCCFDNCKR